jgi:hypothetical protein
MLLLSVIHCHVGIVERRNLRYGPKMHEVTGGWRKLHYDEFHNLYSLPNIIRMTKSRRMRWARHVACKR